MRLEMNADSQETMDEVRQELEKSRDTAAFVAALRRAGNLQDPWSVGHSALRQASQRLYDAIVANDLATGRNILVAFADVYPVGQNENIKGKLSQNLASNAIALGITAKDAELQALILEKLVPPMVTDAILAFNLACWCAGNQNTDCLFHFVHRALCLGKLPGEFQNDGDFAPYLDHPEFQRILSLFQPADLQAITKELERGIPFTDHHLGELATLWFPAQEKGEDRTCNQIARLVRKHGNEKAKEIFASSSQFDHKAKLFRWICEEAPPEVFLRALRPLGDSLNIGDSRIRELPEAIAFLRDLRRIGISGYLQEFPESLLELEDLRALSLYSNKIPELPPGIARLQKLKSLALSRNRLTRLPPRIGALKALESLNLEHNRLVDIPEELCECLALTEVNFSENPDIPGTDLNNLFQQFGKEGTPVPLRKLQLALVLDKLERARELATLPMLVESLNAGSRVIRTNALRCIETMQHNVSLPQGGRIAMVGQFQGKASVWKKRLTDAGYTALTRLDEDVDAIVLGEKVGDIDIEEFDGIVLVENTLKQILDGVQTPYLEDAKATPQASTRNLADLLDSSDPANQKLALELMSSGGVPDNAMMPLFGAAFLSPDAKVRQTAKALLTKHAGPVLQRKLAERVSFLNVATEKKMSAYIENFAEAPEIDAMDLARRVFRAIGKGKLYLFQHAEHEEHVQMLRTLLGKAKEDPDLEGVATAIQMVHSDLESLPDVFDELPELTHLSLRSNLLSELPPSLFRLPNLVWLDLSENKLKKFPDKIAASSRLQMLNLYSNRFRSIPEEVTRLTGLTHLDVSFNQLESIPESMQELKALTELKIWGNLKLHKDATARLKTLLPHCKLE